jgi:chaperonin GroEL
MAKRIEFDHGAREALRRGVEQLAGAVRVTLGPRGRNVVIESLEGSPTISNDGLTIAREIELADPVENMGAQLVREVALKTGEVAGDGTTSATVLAASIISQGLRAVAAGRHPMALKRGIDRAVTAVVEQLRAASHPISTRDDMRRVATVSANQDAEIGAMVAEAVDRVGRLGVVTVEEGRGMQTTLEVVEGLRFDHGYLSPYFVTDPESMEAALDHPLLLLTTQKLSRAQDLMKPLELAAAARRPLLVVADDVEGEALAILVVNRLRGSVQSAAVRAPESGDRRAALLDDMAVMTGATFFGPELGRTLEHVTAADLGRAQRVIVDRDTTTIVEGGGKQDAIRERMSRLERDLDASDSKYDREWLGQRLGRFTGGVAVIHVGAPTEIAMRERKARVEDALAATRSAVEEGVVAGGGVALLRAGHAARALELSGDEAAGRDLVVAALAEPARQIADNAGAEGRVVVERILAGSGGEGFDAQTGSYRDLFAAGIMDPTKVVRSALQHAASIGSMVLTTDAVVVEAPDEDGPGEDPEG